MPVATVTSKGQVTIPKKVRDVLGLRTGDRLDFVIEEPFKVVLRPGSRDIRSLKGLLHRPGRKAVTVEQMSAAIRKRHSRV